MVDARLTEAPLDESDDESFNVSHDVSARFQQNTSPHQDRSESWEKTPSDVESSSSSIGIVFEVSSPSKQVDQEPELPVPSSLAGDSCSARKLRDLQENEFVAICSIFEGGVEELPLDSAACSQSKVGQRSGRDTGHHDAEQASPSYCVVPVRRYSVKLSASSGCSVGGVGAIAHRGPSAELEVSHGQEYPLVPPRFILYNIDGLHEQARDELCALVSNEVNRLVGRECVFDVCMAVCEHLRQHYDPSADLPLHERFKRHAAEEVAKQRAAEQADRARAEQQKAEERERHRLELQRIQEKHLAAQKLGPAFHHDGNLDLSLQDATDDHQAGDRMIEADGQQDIARIDGKPSDKANVARQMKATGRADKAPCVPKSTPRHSSVSGRDRNVAGRYTTDFEELRFLGVGGFGSVTMVRHRVDKHLYAIKRIELIGAKSERERLLQECATLPQLSHLHIVRYYQAWIERESVEAQYAPLARAVAHNGDGAAKLRQIRRVSSTENLDEVDDLLSHSLSGSQRFWRPRPSPNSLPATTLREILYIQMEFCDGTTLREAINHGLLHADVALIWKLFRQILDALAYIHGKGLIHRDLKPPNIFLSRADGGHVRIGDFGLTTQVLAEPPASSTRTVGDNTIPAAPSAHVGTVFYMAPELSDPARAAVPPSKRRQGRAIGKHPPQRLYDQKVDMFSLGVVFFEMWHPPFTTAMERARVLGPLATGLTGSFGLEALLRELHVPKEVGQILASLLAGDPSERMTAGQLLDSNSGLLPPGAYDPQVQRILSALKSPGSTESVALIEALFARCEDAGKDTPFFEQMFRSSNDVREEEAAARDAMQQLVREVCRRHSIVCSLCPLLQPARSSDDHAADRGRRPQLVDNGNTRLELRTNLTEPCARIGAAKLAAAAADTRTPATALRQYHVGSVYQSPKGAHFGHPVEISSAAMQILWQPFPGTSMSATVKQMLPPQAYEAELLHVLAEILVSAGLASPGGRAEFQLADTRLLPTLIECAAHRVLRERRSLEHLVQQGSAGDRAGGGEARMNKLSRLGEAIRAYAPAHVLAAGLDCAVAELAAAFLAAPSSSTASDARTVKTLPVCLSFVDDLAESYGAAPSDSACIQEPADTQATSIPEKLWQMLQNIRHLGRALEGLTETTLDVLWHGKEDMYGPGLVFRVILHDAEGHSTLVAEGGRLDRMLAQFVELHGPPPEEEVAAGAAAAATVSPEELGESPGRQSPAAATQPMPLPAPCGVSAEVAVDKLAAALVAQAAPAFIGVGRRTGRGDRLGSQWWRQLPGCWPLVWVSASPAAAKVAKQGVLGVADEVFKIVRGLWRLGGRCEVQPLDAGLLEAAPWQHIVSQAHLGPSPPDFAVLIRLQGTGDVLGSQELPLPKERRESSPGPSLSQSGCHSVGQRRSGPGRTVPMTAAVRSASPKQSGVPAAFAAGHVEHDPPRLSYEVRAVSEQGLEVMDRATKDHGLRDGGREFDDCLRLFEFFDKLFRRLPVRHSGQGFPRSALEALVLQ